MITEFDLQLYWAENCDYEAKLPSETTYVWKKKLCQCVTLDWQFVQRILHQ